MIKGRCVYCGNIIELTGSNVSKCNFCGNENMNMLASEFNEVPKKISDSIKELRNGLDKALKENDSIKIMQLSNEILNIISNDYKARYYYAYAKRLEDNQYFLNKFISELDRSSITNSDINEIMLHLIKSFGKIDKKKVLEFIKKMAINADEQMYWRDRLDEAIEAIDDEIKPSVYVLYDMESYKFAKQIIEAINMSGYIAINNDEDLKSIDGCKVLVVLSNANSMKSVDVKNKIVYASTMNIPLIEFKLDETEHDNFFNDYLGIDDYIVGFDSFEKGLLELIDAIADEVNGIDLETKMLKINLRKQAFKAIKEEKERINRAKSEEERIKLEQERIENEKKLALEKKIREEQTRKAMQNVEKRLKEKEENERLSRMERMILDSYDSTKIIKSDFNKNIDISKIILKVERLIDANEDLLALDICDDLIERYPTDYRVWFLYVKLLTSNFTYLNDNSHIKYMDRALELANTNQKQELLKIYLPYSNSKEKINVFRKLAASLNKRLLNIPEGIHLCNEGIKAYRNSDFIGAVKYWILGSNIGNSEAQYCLAVQYVSGRYIEQNTQKAMGLFIKAANNGHEKSIMTLADAYEKGLFGIEKDPEASIYYYKKMLDKGNRDVVNIMMRLADIYEKSGYKVPSNRVFALKYYEALAEYNYADAILKCASLHCYGIGNIYDKAKGANYYKIGAELEIEYAMAKYADIVKNGAYDVKKDYKKYVELIKKLALTYLDNEVYQNEYISIYKHGLYDCKKNYEIVLKHYEMLAKKSNNIKYQLKLAEIYENGLYGAKVNLAEVINIYYTLSQKYPENEECQIKMAQIYENGLYGVTKNINTVGQIYATLAKKYPNKPEYLVKLAELFKMSNSNNSYAKSLEYYEAAYKLDDLKAGCMLIKMYFDGDDRNRYKDYNRALEIKGKIKEKYQNELLTGELKHLYNETDIAEMKIYAQGGYSIQKNIDVAKKLLQIYNEKNNEKLKLKDIEG